MLIIKNRHSETRTLTYDNNGNCTSDGVRTYSWDAANRMVAIVNGTHRSEFVYDGLGRRVQIVEKENGSEVSNKRFLWVETEIVEERDSAGTNVTKRFYAQGVQQGGNAFFYTRDHLGSIREMTDNTGAIRCRLDYDPWGRKTKVSGDLECDFGFTGHYVHVPSSLYLAMYRAYDAELGRWLSRDPIGESIAINLYVYCFSNPVRFLDYLGLIVRIKSRIAGGTGGQGSHSWIEVEDHTGRVTYSGTFEKGRYLGVVKNEPRDYTADKSVNAQTEVPPPPGMTQEEWDAAVKRSGECELKKHMKRPYFKLGSYGVFEREQSAGSSNDVARWILENAGGKVPSDYDPPKANPGLHPPPSISGSEFPSFDLGPGPFY